tara:strand:- start:587 stop:2020 length:1434 start_codon:yes stop_codon:yes gene_type:complete
MDNNIQKTELVVIGAGPGGYTAAFRAADLGIKVTLIDKNYNLGGVCLNKGCIPSKSLLHLAKGINDTTDLEEAGIKYSKPKIDIEKIHEWKNKTISNLNSGIKKLAQARKIDILNGLATFNSANQLEITDSQNKKILLDFDNCIIASGSSPQIIPNLNKKHPNIIDSTDALNFNEIPERLLVIGGGYIGLELGEVYSALGSKVTIAEFLPSILSMADYDLSNILTKSLEKKFENIFTATEVTELIPKGNDNVIATFKNNKIFKDNFNKVLICIGRAPNTANLNIEKTGIKLDVKGFIPVNDQRRTLIPNIFAIGDVTGNPMLAHKATHEGKVAAEVIAGNNVSFNPITIPSVIYTNPEVAWCGDTENELNEQSIRYIKAEFPWSASGRALAVGASNGVTKILCNEKRTKILGVGIIGHNAGELINEAVLAIEMGTTPEDLALTIHAHPTLSETIANAAEIINGTITDLYIPKNESKG